MMELFQLAVVGQKHEQGEETLNLIITTMITNLFCPHFDILLLPFIYYFSFFLVILISVSRKFVWWAYASQSLWLALIGFGFQLRDANKDSREPMA